MMKRLGLFVSAVVTSLIVAAPLRAQSNHDAALSTIPIPPSLDGSLFQDLRPALAFTGGNVLQQLVARTLVSPTGQNLPEDAMDLVLGVIQGTIPPNQLAEVLGSGPTQNLALFLSQTLVGILTSEDPNQVVAAIEYFNDLVDASPASYLSNPPAEFLVVWSILSSLAGAMDGAAI